MVLKENWLGSWKITKKNENKEYSYDWSHFTFFGVKGFEGFDGTSLWS